MMLRFDIFIELHGELDCMLTFYVFECILYFHIFVIKHRYVLVLCICVIIGILKKNLIELIEYN